MAHTLIRLGYVSVSGGGGGGGIVEYANLAAFPPVGQSSTIYLALDTKKIYKWSSGSYIEVSPSEVTSVNTETGAVVLDKADIGLGNVDNTSDLNKPVSTATQNAINALSDSFKYNQVVYVDKANTNTYTADGSINKPYKSIEAMYTAITDASTSKRYACIIAPGTYTEAATIRIKGWIDLTAFATDTVIISVSGGATLKWSNNNPGRVFFKDLGFTSGLEILNDNPSGTSGLVFDLDNVDAPSLTFRGRGGGRDFIQLRNDTRISGNCLIQSAATTIFDSTGIGTLTMNDVGCVAPDSYGSAITASIRSNYIGAISISATTYDVYTDIWGTIVAGNLTIASNASSYPCYYNYDATSYPLGTVTLTGTNPAQLVRTSKAESIRYTPAVSGNWTAPVPAEVKDALDNLALNKISISQKGAANGVAPLNASTKIDATYLPSYVDDVEEYANLAAFPPTGEAGKIYVAIDTNKIYRWSGSAYIEISPSPAPTWGSITGTLSNQTDLNNALNAKVDVTGDIMTGPLNMSALSENIQFSVYGLNASQGIEIKSNDDATRPTGNITIKTGNASGSDATGAIYLQGGTNVDGTPGNILLTAGQSSGIGSDGVIVLNAKGVVYLNDNVDGSIDAGSHRIQNVDDPIADQDAATRKWVDDMSAIDNVIFTSPNANATIADGSLHRPYATIAAALAVAVDNNVIALLPGTYNEPTVVIPSSLSYLVIQGIASTSTVITNGISYTPGASSIDLLIQKVNTGVLSLDATDAFNGLISLKQVSVNFNRQDGNSNVLMVVTESSCFGGVIKGGANNFSECLLAVSMDIESGAFAIFENTKFVGYLSVYGDATVRLLDCELFGGFPYFIDGSIDFGNTPTIEIDTASDALGSLVGSFNKTLLANIPLSNLTVSGASAGQVALFNGTSWVPGLPDASNIAYTESTPANWDSSPLQVNNALDVLASRTKNLENGQLNYDTILVDTNEPTGFVDRTESTISFDDSFRKFTIAPAVAEFSFYIRGNKYTKTSAEELVIPNTDGNHYIYYDSNGDLASTTVFSSSIIEQYAFVAIIYWNSEINEHVYFAEERHGITMDGVSHSYLHTIFGARYLSGLALQGFTVDGAGTSNADAQFTSDSGSIRDEDILHILPAQSQIPVYYRQGQLWRRKAPDAFPFIYSGTAGYTGAEGRIPYNQYTGGAWQLTEIANNGFVLVHYFATNDIDDYVIAVQGTNTYGNVTAARLAAATEISSLAGLPFAEFVAIGSVVLESSNSYSNTPQAIVRSIDGGDYLDFRGTQLYTPAGEATTHGLLSGLANDDHPQYHTDARGDIRYIRRSFGDLNETSFSLTNNQIVAANITGFSFNSGVRSFEAQVSIKIDADSDLFEESKICGINKGTNWEITISSIGDVTGVVISITSAGQLQYTSPNYTGFVSGIIKFRALTTSV